MDCPSCDRALPDHALFAVSFTRSVARGTADKVVTSIEDLGSKRCLACEGGEVDPLTEDQISHLASLVRRLWFFEG